MPASPSVGAILSPLVTAFLGLIAGAVGVTLTRIARWHLDSLSRTELLRTLAEYRQSNEDKDRLLVQIREQSTANLLSLERLGQRLATEGERVNQALRDEVRRERYIRLLQRRLRAAGAQVPPEPEEE